MEKTAGWEIRVLFWFSIPTVSQIFFAVEVMVTFYKPSCFFGSQFAPKKDTGSIRCYKALKVSKGSIFVHPFPPAYFSSKKPKSLVYCDFSWYYPQVFPGVFFWGILGGIYPPGFQWLQWVALVVGIPEPIRTFTAAFASLVTIWPWRLGNPGFGKSKRWIFV